jgi:DNA-binding SARP family transcriptional activator
MGVGVPATELQRPVQVALAGGLQVREADGGSVLGSALLGGRQGSVLFACLALDAGKAVSRQALADAIWGERPPASWWPALRNLVAVIRRGLSAAGLDGAIVRVAGYGYRLVLPAGSTVDLAGVSAELERAAGALSSGEHRVAFAVAAEALRTASLPILPGVEGEWVEGLRAQIGELRQRLELTAGEAALALGDAGEAERMARRLVAVSELREDAQRLLVGSLYAAGNCAAALSAYDRFRRALADQLGITPSAQTEALLLEILAAEQIDAGRAGTGDPDAPARLDLQILLGGSQRAIADAFGDHDAATEARVLATVRRSLTGSGRLEEQHRLEAELCALAEQLEDPSQRARAARWRFDTQIERGHGEHLERLLAVAADSTAGQRSGDHHHSLACARASLALLRGRTQEASVLVDIAAAVGRQQGLDPKLVAAARLAQMIGVRHEQHRLRELRELRDELTATFAAAGMTERLCASAFIDSQLGCFETVAQNADAILETFAAGNPKLIAPIGWIALMASPIARLRDRARAAVLYQTILPYSGQGACLAYFAGPIDYHLGVLARAMERERDAKRHFTAATRFCEQLGAPLWQRRCQSAGTRSRALPQTGSPAPRTRSS